MVCGETKSSMPLCDYYYISIHEPNHLPDFDVSVEFKRVSKKQSIKIVFSVIRIKRLGKGVGS